MIRIIGNNGCSRCEVVKQILINKNMEFKYDLLTDLPNDEQNQLMDQARLNGMLNMPLIIRNNKIIDIKEIV